ncbi:MAG: hypothetical protein HZB18_02305 [Chloroflexi bacterium]|nr:hypothetical protein [Chloroflexota bacterium]
MKQTPDNHQSDEFLNSDSLQEERRLNQALAIRWKGLLWLTIGWAISWAIGWELGLELDRVIRNAIEAVFEISIDPSPSNFFRFSLIGLTIGGLIGGAMGGGTLVWVLWKENLLRRKQIFIWVMLGWGIGGAMGLPLGRTMSLAIGGMICGLVGGGIMVWVLWKENIFSYTRSVILVLLGWVIGLAIGWGIPFEIRWLINLVIGWSAVGGFIAWLLRKAKILHHMHSPLWIILGWLIGGAGSFVVWFIGFIFIRAMGDGVGDSPVMAMYALIFLVAGLIVGVATGITFTAFVLRREKTINYMQVFSQIAPGLVVVGLIIWAVVWAMINVHVTSFNFARLSDFAIRSAVSGATGGAIMIWHLKKATKS